MVADRYPYHEELRHVWDRMILRKQKHHNMGFFAPCCGVYFGRTRAKPHLKHKISIKLKQHLEDSNINTLEELIQYHQDTFPRVKPTINNPTCTLLKQELKAKLEQELRSVKEELQEVTKSLQYLFVIKFDLSNESDVITYAHGAQGQD